MHLLQQIVPCFASCPVILGVKAGHAAEMGNDGTARKDKTSFQWKAHPMSTHSLASAASHCVSRHMQTQQQCTHTDPSTTVQHQLVVELVPEHSSRDLPLNSQTRLPIYHLSQGLPKALDYLSKVRAKSVKEVVPADSTSRSGRQALPVSWGQPGAVASAGRRDLVPS